MGIKLRKVLCGVLACGMLAALAPVTAAAASTPFYDVSSEVWYAGAVNFVYATKLMSGLEEKTFGPNIEATRGQIVTILYRMAGQPKVSGKAPFTDVDAGSYCNSAVAWANAMGIVSGTGNGKFQPGSAITREQMAAIFYRYASYKKYNVAKTTNLSAFTDEWQMSSYSKAGISWAVGSGLMNGTDAKHFSPHVITNRAVLATTLMRFCNLYNITVPPVSAGAETVVVAAVPATTTITEQQTPLASAPSSAPAAATPTTTAPAAATSAGSVYPTTLDGSTIQTPKYTFQWPVQGRVSSPYGTREIFGSTGFHRGIDIPAPLGTGVHAGQGGTVSFVGEQGSYGNLVIIDHGNGFQSYYAHNSQLLVTKGEVVKQNQIIAAVGSTGRSTGNHCHFEVHYKGQVVDPMCYLPATNNAPANTIVAVLEPETAEPEAMTREMLILASIY